MKIEHQNLFLNVEEFGKRNNSRPSILFIHGFTGSSKDWLPIISELKDDYHCLAMDLIGHGLSSSPEEIEFYNSESLNNQFLNVINYFELDTINLTGYSMGGRAALNFAVKYPQLLESLTLESTSFGTLDGQLKKERIQFDNELAKFIIEKPIEEFVDYWMNLDIFNTQRRFSNSKLKEIRNLKLENSKTGLANSLRGFGAGLMPDFTKELQKIKCKTLLISGELDPIYFESNSQIVKLLPDAEHKIIKNAGHNTHLEEPKAFIKLLRNFYENSLLK